MAKFCFQISTSLAATYSLELFALDGKLLSKATGEIELNRTQWENAFLVTYEDLASEMYRQMCKHNIRRCKASALVNDTITRTLGAKYTPVDIWDVPEDYDPLWQRKSAALLDENKKLGRTPIMKG